MKKRKKIKWETETRHFFQNFLSCETKWKVFLGLSFFLEIFFSQMKNIQLEKNPYLLKCWVFNLASQIMIIKKSSLMVFEDFFF